ncbi:hypothetical protein [Nocardioides sp. B-3]|uniref:hypothetical protein n=1 Tax=Nocardioides sp. B-3 TaxID=2895565 RepID=UPI0021522BF3|nr:hypothetical protein [Nocardioides sp. B-3]UUZ59720.1 hypothetical protein LP418_00900 [Nocardioides sp. B-3]
MVGAAASSVQDPVEALEAGDAAAASALGPRSDSEARAFPADVADNARDLRLRDISARYVDEVGAVGQDGSPVRGNRPVPGPSKDSTGSRRTPR